MNAKHTPGPWFIGKRSRTGNRVFATQHGADGVVCSGIENEANARLIAAAPELLECLIELCEWAAHMGSWESPVWDRAQSAIDNAIDNAT